MKKYILISIRQYRKPGLCPVLESLPSAKYRALGKGHLCRVPHSAKLGTRQIGLCRVSGTRQNTALGKAKLCLVPDTRQSWALGKEAPGIMVPDAGLFAECLLFGTRQNISFAECLGLALGKINFFFVFCHQLFLLDLYLYHEQHVQIWHNFIAVCYISSLISFSCNFPENIGFNCRCIEQ